MLAIRIALQRFLIARLSFGFWNLTHDRRPYTLHARDILDRRYWPGKGEKSVTTVINLTFYHLFDSSLPWWAWLACGYFDIVCLFLLALGKGLKQ